MFVLTPPSPTPPSPRSTALIFNILMAPFTLKEHVSRADVGATAIALVGIFCVAVFGPHECKAPPCRVPFFYASFFVCFCVCFFLGGGGLLCLFSWLPTGCALFVAPKPPSPLSLDRSHHRQLTTTTWMCCWTCTPGPRLWCTASFTAACWWRSSSGRVWSVTPSPTRHVVGGWRSG